MREESSSSPVTPPPRVDAELCPEIPVPASFLGKTADPDGSGVDEACNGTSFVYAYVCATISNRALGRGAKHMCRMRLRDYGEKTPTDQMRGRAHNQVKPGGLACI